MLAQSSRWRTSCVATWWSAVRGQPLPTEYGWRRELARRGYFASDIVVAPTAAFAQETAKAHGIEPPLVCRNGSDWPSKGDLLAPRHGIIAAGRLWDEGKGMGVLSAVGRLDPPIRIAGALAEPGRPAVSYPGLEWLGSLDAEGLAGELSKGGGVRQPRVLRAVRPYRTGSRPSRLRSGAVGHPDLPRALAGTLPCSPRPATRPPSPRR